jgi:O-antigen/teichoic acid export membrane protein
MNYFKKTINGVAWTSALSGSVRLVSFVKIAILARLLVPSQFGEFGVVIMVLAFLEIITETGINIFLLQERGEWEKYINTAWVVSMLRGTIVAAAMIVSAGFIADFFNIESTRNLLLLAALIPFIRGFINPACIRFQKNLEFNKEFFYRFSIIFLEVAITAVLAYQMRSTGSLVWGLIIASTIEVIVSWAFVSPRPVFKFEASRVREVIGRGKWVTAFGLFDFVFTTGDNVAVGRLLDSFSLGIYQNAYKLASLPSTQVNDIYYKSTTPIFVKMLESHENESLKRFALKSSLAITGIHLIIGLLVFALAESFVLIFLGPNWIQAIHVVRVLAILGPLRGLMFVFNSLFVAAHRQKFTALITLVSTLTMIIVIVPMVTSYGIIGAAYSAIIGAALGLPLMIFLSFKLFRSL